MKQVKMEDEHIELLKKLNPGAMVDDDIYFILEMEQDTGTQNLIAAPNFTCPVYGPPAVVSLLTALGENSNDTVQLRSDPMAAAAKLLRAGRKVFFAVGHLGVSATPKVSAPKRLWSLARDVYIEGIELQELLDGEVEHSYIPECNFYVQDLLGDDTPVYKQAEDDAGNKLYRWQAVPFACRELAESYIKERGVDTCSYIIMKADCVVVGKNTMEELEAVQEAEDAALAAQE